MQDNVELFDAHVDLARRYGRVSEIPVVLSKTIYLASPEVADRDGTVGPSVLAIPVGVAAVAKIAPMGALEDLGTVSWRDGGLGYSARYFISPGKTPSLLRAVDRFAEEDEVLERETPYSEAWKAFGFFQRLLPNQVEIAENRKEEALVKTASDFVSSGVERAVGDIVFVAGPREDDIRKAVPAHVPYYRVSRSDYANVDPVWCDVQVDRDYSSERSDWSFGMQFEAWEAEIARDVMVACGDRRAKAPQGLDGLVEHAWDLAIVNRMGMQSLLPLFLKKAMLDLGRAGMEGTYVDDATSIVYSAVSRNEWNSLELTDALSHLDDLWRVDARLSSFTRSMGWDIDISPFSVMCARVEAFPWRTAPAAPVKDAALSP